MADNVTSLFRSTAAHSPSMAALTRESDGAGPVDFCIPCNPYFPTPAMFDEMASRLRDIITYYPSSADTITAELCSLLRLPPQCVAMGNGSTELITWIDHLLVRESLAVPVPTFGRWTDQPMETGKRVDMFPLQESSGFALDLAQYAEFIRARGTRVAVVCNPNNPDGGFLHRHAVVQFMDAMADLDLVVIDESFLEFADAENEPSVVQEAMLRPNVIVLRSLGKNFGLHGIRFGYLVANPALAGRVRSMLPKWNLNSFAEHVVFMLKEHGAEYAQSLHQVRRDRMDMSGQLSSLPGLTVYPSQGNFLFVRLPVGAEGTVVRDRLLTEHRILVRECGNKIGSSSRFLRLVVRPQVDVRRLVTGLEQVLYGTSRRGAAVPEQATGTAYSSGTAAVDRLVSQTNGAGTRGLAQAAGAGMPLPAAAPAPAAVGPGGGMPVPAAAGLPQPEPRPVPQEAPRPQPVPQPAPQPVPQPIPVPQPQPVPVPQPQPQQFPQPAAYPEPASQPLAPAAAFAAPAPAPTPVPAPVQVPPATGPTPPGVPARGGLTAAQVRGTDGLSMAPATGWPGAQSWPDAAGMGQAAG
ncbi:histidinol-phosphate aminotransferase family protein [Streptomyces cellulosae]|uniref:aminotransferase class I/II-fold pyridoxal phosphate-dependent enzyme n=2 Tax=Streptomyces TaxID=1883 RepID=UPI00048E6B94|nr:histidinol-phosphate aminotransferase family protein [Streptomyces cellulosae]MXQ58716.1 aminotransferase class I/II-fold pyridoxal phosphate-dependent enzyme [Streptomyces sp. XHT-2]WSB50081.1 histidinol-phosphate aminotransferase family protein [Streptomyces cellulosae]WSB90952.1 histidinol-phosphate aminotransferase family protein [Streptomyces cellulosae]WTC58329.1 histidinol-phosphate aminotransferase family protein [Streptomyces cellulosae]